MFTIQGLLISIVCYIVGVRYSGVFVKRCSTVLVSVCAGNQLTIYGCLLQELNISHCLNVTDEGVQSVVTQCPQLSILVFHGCPLLTSLSRDIASNGRQMKQLTWTIY